VKAVEPALVEAAEAAVRAACAVCRSVTARGGGIAHALKSDQSPVTIADYAAQAVVMNELVQRIGELRVVGEEDATDLRTAAALRDAVVTAVRVAWPTADTKRVLEAIDRGSAREPAERYWTLDPIDGTKGFLAGRHYAVCLALVEGETPVLGVLGCPNLAMQPGDAAAANDGALFVAARGHPPWMRALDKKDAPRQFLAPVHRDRPQSVVVTHSVERGHSSLESLGEVLAHVEIDAVMRPVDSQAKYALVARGDAHAYLRIPQEVQRVETVWDHAAGVAIARATGNVATDLRGRPLDFSACPFMVRNRGIVCAHPSLHGDLIEAIDALGLG